MTQKTAVVIGAGVTGAAAAWELMRHGYQLRVYEKADVIAGHVRTEWLHGIPYEPHGAHIFHTYDAEIWDLVTKLADFTPYRHRVMIRLHDQEVGWPLQVAELTRLPMWGQVGRELANLPTTPDDSNFETYCVSLLGRTLYNACVRDYTRKQWGRDPEHLSASVGRNRVELRRDGYLDLFRDPYQGWPRHGYTALVEAMLDGAQVHLGHHISASDIADATAIGEPVIVTSALDDFFHDELGTLEWRGVRLQPEYLPSVSLAQAAMVVNEPDLSRPWTRTVETKWALRDLHERRGTVIMREYPGTAAKHYPVPDSHGRNRALQAAYEKRIAAFSRNPLRIAGRLATYSYINMDEAIRQGVDAARTVLKEATPA